MNVFRRVLLVTALLSLGGCATQAPLQKTRLKNGSEIYAHTAIVGSCVFPPSESRIRSNSPSGYSRVQSNTKMLEAYRRIKSTRKIRGKPGSGAALLVEINGLPEGRHRVKMIFRHPEWRMPHGKTQTVFSREDTVRSRNGAAFWEFSYCFDAEFEATPGPWEFELHYQGRRIYEEHLTILPARN